MASEKEFVISTDTRQLLNYHINKFKPLVTAISENSTINSFKKAKMVIIKAKIEKLNLPWNSPPSKLNIGSQRHHFFWIRILDSSPTWKFSGNSRKMSTTLESVIVNLCRKTRQAARHQTSHGTFFELFLGKNKLFNDWIMQQMAPHSLGRATLLHKSVLPITMIFYMVSFLRIVITKTCSALETI